MTIGTAQLRELRAQKKAERVVAGNVPTQKIKRYLDRLKKILTRHDGELDQARQEILSLRQRATDLEDRVTALEAHHP